MNWACQWRRMLCCIVIVIASADASAQATQPVGRFDQVAVRGTSGRDGAAPTTSAAKIDSVPAAAFDWPRVAFALVMVVGLILLMRFAGKRWLGASAVVGAGKMVRVLGRVTTGPRQQVILLQIGRRIVVAADNAGQMCSLCQITEADEVASLLGQLDETRATAPARGFASWFKKAETDFGDEPEAETLVPAGASMIAPGTDDPSLERARGEIAGLMERVRSLASQFRK